MSEKKPTLFLTGQNGMLGQQITTQLSNQFSIHGLTRNGSANNPSWNYRELLQTLDIETPDVVIHLAGAGIADKRWSKKYKQTIHDSRINGTQWLVDEMQIHDHHPNTFICASAIGYYGNRPDEELDETSSTGDNYVAQIASNWEKASARINAKTTRLINLRFGMILSDQGGALKNMLLPFKLGLGGKLGDGQQKYSWISISDATKAINFLINNKSSQGVYNLTTPHAVSNQVFTKCLAQSLNRPAFMHMPATIVRLLFGEVADELLLASADVKPTRLVQAGFEFDYPELSMALEAILN